MTVLILYFRWDCDPLTNLYDVRLWLEFELIIGRVTTSQAAAYYRLLSPAGDRSVDICVKVCLPPLLSLGPVVYRHGRYSDRDFTHIPCRA